MNSIIWLRYFIGEAFRNIKANILTSIVTISTIAISLFICGLFFGIFTNLSTMLNNMGDKIEIIAYIKDNISFDAISKIKSEVTAMSEVDSFEYISKDKAFSVFREELKEKKGFLEGLDANPFPASLEIKVKKTFRTPNGIRDLISKLKTTSDIEEVQYGQEWLNKLFAFIKFVELFAFIIGGFLLLGAVFIVSNTIRLAIYARREEIEILGLMGATGMFIKAPFIIEGIVEGFVGAMTAIGILFSVRELLILKTPLVFMSLIDMPVSTTYFISGLIISGIMLGIIGSSLSLRKGIRM